MLPDPILAHLAAVMTRLRRRLAELRADESGALSPEWVIIAAALAACALGVTGYIVAKVITKAHSISF